MGNTKKILTTGEITTPYLPKRGRASSASTWHCLNKPMWPRSPEVSISICTLEQGPTDMVPEERLSNELDSALATPL